MKKNNKGFTLLELLGVVLIIGFLLLVVAAGVTKIMNSSRQKLIDVQLKALESAAETYVASKSNLLPKLRSETTTIFLHNLKHAGLVEKNIKHPVTEELLPDDTIVEIHRDGNFFEYRAIEDSGTHGNIAEDEDLIIVVMGALDDTVQQNYFTHNWANEEAIKAFTTDGTQIDNSHINVTITVDSTVISELETNILREYLVEYKIEYMGYERTIIRKVNLVDTLPPSLAFSSESILTTECETYDWETGGVNVADNSGSVILSYEGTVDCVPGNYTLTYTAEDPNGNQIIKERNITIVEFVALEDPEEPPEPKGPVCAGTFIDERDGKEYRKVTIGNQCWMKDNLAYLPSVVSGSTFSNNNPHYYVYGYVGTNVGAAKATANYQTYGAIYNWHAATGGLDGEGVQGACPDGWFIPTDDDWKQLEMEMGMTQIQADGTMWRGTVQGQYMKSKVPASQQGTDIYGFSAMLGGRLATGVWNYVGTGGYYWTSTVQAANQSLMRYLTDTNVQVNREQITLDTGFSVKCIMHDFEPDPDNQMPVAVVGESCYEAFATDARDGKTYDTVQLGSQCWFAENLAYLPAVHTTQGFTNAGNSSTAAYGVYGYSGTTVSAAKALDAYTKYGALYNWHAVSTAGICPAGWRVPSDNDWQQLSILLGMTPVEAAGTDAERGYPAEVGTKMKIVPPGWDGIDSVGFRGVPAGLRTNAGAYLNENFDLILWSSTQSTTTNAWLQALFLNDIGLYRTSSTKANGFSVRCIYDE